MSEAAGKELHKQMKIKDYLIVAVAALWFALPAERVMAVASSDVNPDSAADSSGVSGAYLAGRFARTAGDMEEAIRALQRVHKLSPEDLDIARQLQGMLLLQGHVDEAVTLSNDIRKSDQGDALSVLLLTLDAVKRDDMQQAGAILESGQDAVASQLWQPLVMMMSSAVTTEPLSSIRRAICSRNTR